jgi:transposase
MSLMARRLALRPGSETPIASSKHVLRALARRWRDLNAEIQEHAEILEVLVRQVAPQVTAAFASGADTAAEVLIVVGDNPQRIRSEAAWAKLCGVAPLPASSGTTTQHRLNRGGTPPGSASLCAQTEPYGAAPGQPSYLTAYR